MATREENLKKINAELEQLSDEELDNVAGGYTGDADYVKLLKDFGDFLTSEKFKKLLEQQQNK